MREGRVVQLVLLFIIIGRQPPCQQCHHCGRLAAVRHCGAQDQCLTPQLPEAKKKKEKMMCKDEEKSDLMRKLAALDAEDANDNESAPPSLTPV